MSGLFGIGVLAVLGAAGFFCAFRRMRRQQQQIESQQGDIDRQTAKIEDLQARLHLKDIIESQDDRDRSSSVLPLAWLAGFGRDASRKAREHKAATGVVAAVAATSVTWAAVGHWGSDSETTAPDRSGWLDATPGTITTTMTGTAPGDVPPAEPEPASQQPATQPTSGGGANPPDAAAQDGIEHADDIQPPEESTQHPVIEPPNQAGETPSSSLPNSAGTRTAPTTHPSSPPDPGPEKQEPEGSLITVELNVPGLADFELSLP